MRKFIFSFLILSCLQGKSQNVAINIEGTPASDSKSLLEIRKEGYAKLRIATTSFIEDTSIIELSHRNSIGQGTDFAFKSINESGLLLSTSSDVPENQTELVAGMEVS